MKMQRHLRPLLCLSLIGITIAACQKESDPGVDINLKPMGTLNIEITDAPIDDPSIANAFFTIDEIHVGDSLLTTGSQTVDLLAFQAGNTKMVGSMQLPAQEYSQIKVQLNLQQDALGNYPGCYLATKSGQKFNLYPSDQLHLQIDLPTDELIVRDAEETTLVLDFDLRKMIVQNANPDLVKFKLVDPILLPKTIRALPKSATGSIRGTFSYAEAENEKVLVFAYPEGTFSPNAEISSTPQSPSFINASNSALLDKNGQFILPYLRSGSYDLIFAKIKNTEGTSLQLLDAKSGAGNTMKPISLEAGNEVMVQGVLEAQNPS